MQKWEIPSSKNNFPTLRPGCKKSSLSRSSPDTRDFALLLFPFIISRIIRSWIGIPRFPGILPHVYTDFSEINFKLKLHLTVTKLKTVFQKKKKKNTFTLLKLLKIVKSLCKHRRKFSFPNSISFELIELSSSTTIPRHSRDNFFLVDWTTLKVQEFPNCRSSTLTVVVTSL